MKKATNRMVAAAVAISALASTALPTLAADAVTTDDVMHQIQIIQRSQSSPWEYVPQYDAAGGVRSDGLVNFYEFDQYEGIVISCKQPAALEGETFGDAVLGKHVYLHSYEEKLEILQLRAQAFKDHYEVTFEIPAEYAENTDSIYVLDGTQIVDGSVYGDSFDTPSYQMIAALLADDRLEVLGIMQGRSYAEGWFSENESGLLVVPTAGTELDLAAFETDDWHNLRWSGAGYHQPIAGIAQEGMHFDIIDQNVGAAEAADLCRRLAARDDIAFAWMEGLATPSPEYCYTREAKIVPLQAYDLGDLDYDGAVTMDDAVLALRTYVQGMMSEVDAAFTQEQMTRADINADGAVTPDDAVLILRYYTTKTVLDNADMTFAELMQ